MQKKIYEVRVSGQEWILRLRGGGTMDRFSTRREAVERGREVCRSNRPALLKIEKKPLA